MSQDTRLVGKWTGRRLDAQTKVSGQMPYGNDFNLPNQAYMAIKHSSIPSGTITSMDTSAALATPGVLAIITPDDVKNNPAWKKISIIETGFSLLPYDKVRCAGEEIAAVVAEDPYTAEEACQKIKVTYQPSNFVIHADDAAKSGAPQVYDGTPNTQTASITTFGDADAAFNATDVQKFSSTLRAQNLQHNNVGTYAFTVSYDSTGRIELYTSSQGPKDMRTQLATHLGIGQSRIRIFNYACDGGFGDKGGPLTAMRPHILGTLMAQKTGRPIHHRYTHEDNLVIGFHSNEQVYSNEVAVKADGTVTAVRATDYSNGSAFGAGAAGASLSQHNTVYKFPNFKLTGYSVWTNTGKSGPYRAPGSKQASFGALTFFDKIAASLKMNPVDWMKKNNMYVTGDVDQVTGNRIPSIGQPACLNQVLTTSNFMAKWKAPPAAGTKLTGVVHGIGISSAQPGNGAGASANTCVVILQPDGSLNIHAEPNSLGQGNREQKILIAAEHMGLPFERVTLNNYDTDGGTDVGATVGSQSTKKAGNGIGLACIDAKAQMMNKAATALGTTIDKLTYALDGTMKIFVTADTTKFVTFASLAGEPMIVGVGHMTAPAKTTGRSYNTMVAEVDVDTDTGLVTVTDFYIVQDCGRVHFKAGAEAQAQGSVMQAIGYALFEELVYDPATGVPLCISHLDHKMALATQTPNISVGFVEIIEGPPDSYNFGGKGMGEVFIGNATAVIVNAVANATGWWPESMPVTPEKVLKALGKA